MKRRSYVLSMASTFLVCSILLPGRASGQGNTWAGTSLAHMVEAARWRLGLLRFNASIEFANSGYDSDIYFGYLADAVPDFTFSAGAPIQVLLPVGKKVVLDLYDKAQYSFYLDTKNERALNNTFRGQLHIAFDRFYIQAGADLDNIRQRLSHELNINVRQKSNALNGLVLWQVSQETSLALLYKGTRYDFGDAEFGGVNIAETLNRREDYLDFIAYLQPNSRIKFYVNGQYGTHAFAQVGPISRDTRSYAFFGGLEFIPKARETRPVEGVQGSLSLGYKRFDLIDPSLRDSSGFAGKARLSAGLMAKTTGRVFFFRDFQFSIFSGAAHYVSLSYGGGLTRHLSRRISASYDLLIGQSSYPQFGTGAEGVPPGDSNRFTTHMLSLDIRLARDLRILLLGTLGKRVVDVTGLTRNRNFAGFGLVYGAAMGSISTPVSSLSR